MLPRLTTVTTIALALCACGLVPVARGLAADRPLVVGVFGGSTSVGGGDPATPAHALWHAVAADMLQGVTGRSVQVGEKKKISDACVGAGTEGVEEDARLAEVDVLRGWHQAAGRKRV